VTTSTPPPAEGFLLKRPNRWPSGRRFRQRHLRAFQLEQRIGSILLAVAASLLINGLAFWQLYTAKPPPLPLPEPEPVIVVLGDPAPDPEALTDLAPLVPAETGEEPASPTAEPADLPASVAGAEPAPTEPAAPPPAPAPPEAPAPVTASAAVPPAPAPSEPQPEEAEALVEVTLPPPEPAVAASAQDLTDLPADTGEVLAAEVASPEPDPAAAPGNALTEAEPAAPVEAVASEVDAPEPIETPRPPSLPPDAAEQLARLLESPTVEVELPTLPPQAASEPLRALPPQLRAAPVLAPLPEPDVAAVEPEIAPTVANLPPATLPPETSTPIERATPPRPELVLEPLSPDAPVARPVAPPRSRTLARAELAEPERPTPPVTATVAPVAPVVAVPESQRPAPTVTPAERPRVDLELAVQPPSAPPPVALPPERRAEPERVRPAAVAVELPRERPTLTAPAPAVRAALPPVAEDAPAAPAAPTAAAPALDREALRVEPQAPARLDSTLVAESEAVTRPSAPAAPAAGSDADFGLPSARPGAADGLDWADSIQAATRDQVAEESAARRAARAPWQRDEAWLPDDPPARMEQLLRDDPNLTKAMVDFLVRMLIAGVSQTPTTLYEVGPDPGVLIKLWLDRHHGDLQLACRREAAEMPESARRVLCPGERTEALEFDAARPVGD
jgi:hypothetical protein